MRFRPAPLALGLLLLALLAPDLRAQTSRETAFDLLRLEPSARAAALAGTGSALPTDDPTAVFYNPALLTDGMDRGLALGYLNHLSDVNAGFVSYARTIPRVGTLAAGIRYLSYGDFERADEDGIRDGSSFGAGEAAVTLSYARAVGERFRVGANAHALFATIDDAGASAVAADLGALYEIPQQALTVALSLHNVGVVANSLGEASDRLPFDLRLGVTKRLQYVPLTLSVAGYNLHDYGGDGNVLDEALRHVAVGGELRLGTPVALRVGYNPRRHEELATGERLDLAGVSGGFGLRLRRFGFDYAYNGWSLFGGLHQLSIRTRI